MLTTEIIKKMKEDMRRPDTPEEIANRKKSYLTYNEVMGLPCNNPMDVVKND